ncbi:MAG: LLM class F420-dependent oxidoreductase [Acidimicrobiales bacterium]|nr:LLM class F420-dependent oxidoreductase [Acidimicrobiales bacterium]
MKVDGGLGNTPDIATIIANAKAQEAAGYDGVWTAETSHDPFLPLVLAAEHTQRMELGTSIAVAFARNPMLLANLGWDLQALSGGRFNLGLGTQIKPHITKRFSMEWSKPAARAKEMVSAIRAIWDTWEHGEPLAFRGEFYTHTLMTPFFTPDKADLGDFGRPNVWLAGVGELMTRTAGEVCDGFICHGFTTEKYLREVTLPNLAEGRERAGKSLDGFMISGPFFVVTGTTEEEFEQAMAATKQQIAFYGSTPAYAKVLELHGWDDLQPRLNTLSKQGDWKGMGELIDDEVLDAFAVVGEPDTIAPGLLERYGDVVDRISFYAPGQSDIRAYRPVMDAIKAG